MGQMESDMNDWLDSAPFPIKYAMDKFLEGDGMSKYWGSELASKMRIVGMCLISIADYEKDHSRDMMS